MVVRSNVNNFIVVFIFDFNIYFKWNEPKYNYSMDLTVWNFSIF